MSIPELHLTILIKLLAAHLIGDFLLQPDNWVIDRNSKKLRSKFLYLHSLIHGILAYVFIAEWTLWLLPLMIVTIHFVVDLIKIYKLKSLNGFVLDQFIHIVSLVIIWILFFFSWNELISILKSIELGLSEWAIITSYIIVIWPGDVFINKVTGMWNIQSPAIKGEGVNTGKWIGIIERILILTFIIAGQLSAIGFLIAAKSVFRIGEVRGDLDGKKAEYILIGTLLSFGIATVVGIILVKFFLSC